MMIRLLFVVLLVTGALAQSDFYVPGGELVVLRCGEHYKDGAGFVWRSGTNQTYSDSMSVADRRQMGVVLHGNTLVILSASAKHQGNYSCSRWNGSNESFFRLTVYSTPSKEHDDNMQYPRNRSEGDFVILACDGKITPSPNTTNLTSIGITWCKPGGECEPSRIIEFSRVTKKDSGVYTCIMTYQYQSQLYNMSYKVVLRVGPKIERKEFASIIEPKNHEVFDVDLDAPKVIACKAKRKSRHDMVYWLSNRSIVKKNNSLPIFYNVSSEEDKGVITASLVFKKVSEKDLDKNFTCKLHRHCHNTHSFVTVKLRRKARPSYVPLAACSVVVVMVVVVTVIIYVKFKVDITLFMRDTVGCHSVASDGKNYDVFMMSYKCEAGGGLSGDDRKKLEIVLEERFGYRLCLFDRNVLPGESVSEAVLDCIEQSRAVVLVPSSPDPGLESGVLSAIHEALVERQTRLIFIKADAADVSDSGSIPEALQLLSEARRHVTWRGRSSMLPSSFFWKQLRYYLSAPRQLCPHNGTDDISRTVHLEILQ